jgi:hypothetical protein
MERRNGAVQDVIDAIEMFGFFYRRYIGRFLDYAYQSLIAGGAAAVDAGIDIGNVVASRA